MAKSIVSTVVGKLGELLSEEVDVLQRVDGELRSLCDEFQWIKALLKDVDATIQGGNERAKTWVNQVHDVAYDAEDAIDTYIFKIHRHRRGSHGCFSSLMTTDACHPSRLTLLHDLGIEIGKVKKRAEDISANRSKYGIDSVGATSSDSLMSNEARLPLSWKQTPVVEEVDVVGFDEVAKKLVQLLLAEDEDTQDTQRRRPVISIVGMGGLGKTTLAKKVFSRIKQHFACHVWVYVSQSYTDRELVESIANQLMVVGKVRMNESTDEELKNMIYEHLRERRYLVVIDDIWTRGAWDNVKEVLPAEILNGSKVDHNHPGLFMSFQIPRILLSMKLLRVIDLHNLEIIVPNAIGELIHLRYLNVLVVPIKPLPSSIGELTNLQTLEIQNKYSTVKLPSEIWKSNLRHLKCDHPFSIKGQPSVNSQSNLQTLSWIKAGKWLYNGLDKMTNLRNLSIDDINNSHGKALSDFLGKLNNLIGLGLRTKDPSYEHEIPTSILTASHHKHLRFLRLSAN
ncbi:P-loop containing nucleoside triphosphate hydrolase protein [Dioscorea alata]|uniref:P-loop containing nucleoside triphosphate hydrolase protein n=1 Tax=Dioscorea alata TaxID=55571 RepID=A0ACB7VJB4_DIOAL|nr:P-loop containing nucleoside triphosphate hydrolase protein [Dioscorea alata]